MKNKFSLSVQYVVSPEDIPSRANFRKWVNAALQGPARITLRIVGEEEGRELNRNYRNKDYATNVLTFVYDDLCGDIVLCAPVVRREALEQEKKIDAHYAHLTVHALLHLQGYDHETEKEAQEMEEIETQVLKKMGYPDPYA